MIVGVILAVMSALFLFASTSKISEQCELRDETQIICICVGNEEFVLPEGYNYENIRSLSLSSCVSANLHFSSLTEASRIEEIIVQNISERLIFELFLTSKKIKRFRISNVGRIPVITHDTFRNLKSIDTFEIENVTIGKFKEQFTDVKVNNFIAMNVTIERIDGVNLSEKGESLRVTDSEFRNVTTSLNFAYSNVEIVNSKFELQKPGRVSITSDVTLVENSVFSNVTMNIVATSSVTINSTCADGKSSLRLSSSRIASFGNKLPTEIIYNHNKQQQEFFLNRNNTVCRAGNCKCPKTNGQSSHHSYFLILILESLLLLYKLQ